MPRRERFTSRRARLAIGDLRHVVEVGRQVSAPRVGGKTEKAFELEFTAFMAIELIRPGPSDVNEVNTDDGATHLFRCRYGDQFNARLQLRFQGCFFEILNITDLDPLQTFMEIKARVTGEATAEASQA